MLPTIMREKNKLLHTAAAARTHAKPPLPRPPLKKKIADTFYIGGQHRHHLPGAGVSALHRERGRQQDCAVPRGQAQDGLSGPQAVPPGRAGAGPASRGVRGAPTGELQTKCCTVHVLQSFFYFFRPSACRAGQGRARSIFRTTKRCPSRRTRPEAIRGGSAVLCEVCWTTADLFPSLVT